MAYKIAFMGSDAIALPLLDYLHTEAGQDVELVGVISQPDRPVGRGKKIQPNPISAWALESDIELLRPEKPGQAELDWVNDKQIDLVLVMAYGHILKEDLFTAPRCGMINFHASILPKFRGASPVESAILAGESETGVSLMDIVKRMDAGNVYDIERVAISSEDTGPSLREKLSHACLPLIQRNLLALLERTASSTPQDEAAATYCTKISKEDGRLDFSKPATILERQTRAFIAWPGTFFDHADQRIKVGSATVIPSPNPDLPAGTITQDSEGCWASTGQGTALRLNTLQRPGGKMLPAKEFLKGYKF